MTELPASLAAALSRSYRLERELGQGGMATVYLAYDLKHHRQVAIKVLRPALAAVIGAERFLSEIKTTAGLQHPHILPLFDSGLVSVGSEELGVGSAVPASKPPTPNTLLYYVMPFIEGESLRDRLTRDQQLSIVDTIRIATEVASALDYAHRHGVIHRDLKPENILLAEGGAVLADFGIALAVKQAGGRRLTETGISVGTPHYMSPEQAAGEREIDGRSDIYGLGAVVYELLAGEPPFRGVTAQAVIAKLMTERPTALTTIRSGLPAGIDSAVQRALAKVPADRWGSASALVEALALAASGGERAPRPGRPRVAAMLAVLLAAALVIGGWLVRHRSRPPAQALRLAVLPFDNVGPPDQEYFADGMSDEVRGKLTTMAGLAVIGRSSSVQFKHLTRTLQQIGNDLSAQYLLTGTVRWQRKPGGADQVEVIPELVRAADGAAVWSQSFQASLTDVFQVQSGIAVQVAHALDIPLDRAEVEHLSVRPTSNLAAYDAYLQGEELSDRLGAPDPASMRRALNLYQRAVTIDSTFALAFTRIAAAHAIHFIYSPWATPNEAALTRTAADRGLALAPTLPAAHVAEGMYHTLVVRDFPAALDDYDQARRLMPNGEEVELLNARGLTEQFVGRWDASVADLREAQSRDPRSLATYIRLSRALLWLRRYPEAVRVTDSALVLAPANLVLLENKVMLSLAQGDLTGARAVLRAAPPAVDSASLVTFMAATLDLYWALDDGQQRLLLTLTPAAFDGDRATWAMCHAETYAVRGALPRARAYADSALLAMEPRLRAGHDPDIPFYHALLLTYSGRVDEALREIGPRARASLSDDGIDGPVNQFVLARIYTMAGKPELAIDALDSLLRIPFYLSPGWLRVDPTFAPLRRNPRFARLTQG